MQSITKTVYVDNIKVEFARLDLNDLFTLCDVVQAEREQVARVLCKEEKLDKYETMNVVLDVRRSKVTIQEILAACSNPKGAFDVLLKSLAKSGKKDDEGRSVISQINIPDCIDIARMLVLDVQEETPEEKPEVKAESPLAESPSTSAEPVKTQVVGQQKVDAIGFYGKETPAAT